MSGCDKEGRYLKKPKKVTEESVVDVESMIDTKSHIETNTRSDAEFRRFGKMMKGKKLSIAYQSLMEGLQKEDTKQRVRDIAKRDGVEISKEYLRRWRANTNGVDLNRNFDAMWNEYNDHKGHPYSLP